MMLINILNILFVLLSFLSSAHFSPLVPGGLTLSRSFLIGFWDGANPVGVPLIRGVIVVHGSRSGSVGLDSITITLHGLSLPIPSFPSTQPTIRWARRPAGVVVEDCKHSFFPPSPTIPVAIPSYHLNFSTLNDVRVAWSKRLANVGRQRSRRLCAACRPALHITNLPAPGRTPRRTHLRQSNHDRGHRVGFVPLVYHDTLPLLIFITTTQPTRLPLFHFIHRFIRTYSSILVL
ncbi:hypothetical protein GY45DRAFT_1321710 [Cubamyces sp. BRFM 1775]|nr:hypothetical protein GY45DRAFT_1321710 [Cubamyces sp. BRFM 1775]